MRQLRRIATGLALSGIATMSTSCSVADILSDAEILEELDEVFSIEGSGEDRRIAYADRANLSRWYMRLALVAPIRSGLAWTFGRRQVVDLENPGAHVRELLRELPDETGGDLLACAVSTSRFGWLAELDRNAETRVLAIDGLAAMCLQLGIEPFAEPFEQLGLPPDAEQLNLARAGIEVSRPAARGDGPWTEASLEPYRQALAGIVARPLEGWADRILLVEQLAALYAAEPDYRVRSAVALALRRAIDHCVRGILLRTIEESDPDRRLAEVRLCALEQIRRLGGARTVPLMLAAMAASPAERARNESLFDPDDLVQLRLIHYCGQLDAELRDMVVRLPGRKDWEATSPAEFLARTVLSERSYYSKLRTPALVALTWCLGRPRIDPDPSWVREWLESRGS